MKLSTLLNGACNIAIDSSVFIDDLTLDSRLVKPGSLFFACQGTKEDGRSYIADAMIQGASAILIEGESVSISHDGLTPLITVPNLSQKVSAIAGYFYGSLNADLHLIGVTGTSGKTSCTYFIASLWQQLGAPCGLIGTLGNGVFGHLQPSALTTPDAVTLQKTLAEFLKTGVKTAVMEVSSHSLDQNRVKALSFDVGVFTNLSRDHLDYHGTMERYGAAKKRLFEQTRQAVINIDDAFGLSLAHALSSEQHCTTYSIKNQKADVFANQIRLTDSGLIAHIMTPWGEGELRAPLIGEFNLSNLLAALSTLCLMGKPLADVLTAMSYLQAVPGRMQVLGGQDKPLVIVDYAHKPDALEKVLIALRAHCQGQLFCVFGCGGDRDKGKRPIMAAIAEKYADRVVVTNDNPRHEDPQAIIDDILAGFHQKERVIIEQDRSKAIQDVIQYAGTGDCILIAGKGAETYQLIGDKKYPFSDIDQVKNLLG